MLTDRYGPRPTGSPNLKAAGEWAVTELESWGLQNGRMEPWDWGNPGWLNERLAAHIISPVKDHLVAEALAWTPGTKGPVQAAVVQITLPVRPTKQELSAHLEALREKVKGKIVLVGAHQQVSVTFNDVPERRDDREVLQILNAPPAAGRGAPPSTQKPTAPERQPLTNTQITAQLYEFLLAAGALVRVNDAGRDHGQIRAFANNTYDPAEPFQRSCCATRTTGASRGCWRMARRSSSSSTSSIGSIPKGARATTRLLRFPARPTRL